ncbi:heme-binding protein [Undibacterium sp. SXout7W]|uniref:heme-binding protein n=1 Tax=Undibacterium sp. SXout7W TaxID=3413049 RepID=UPI003BF1ADDF
MNILLKTKFALSVKRPFRLVGRVSSIRSISAVSASALILIACGSGGDGGNAATNTVASACNFSISSEPQALSAIEVEQIVAQGIEAASALGAKATFAVVDRSGNVLAVFKMNGAIEKINIGSLKDVPAQGLDGLNGIVPSELASIAKAITGAYLSSSGNAFSTRTASYIIQNHFAPGVLQTAGGPLFGVQFSQLPCGDLVTRGVTDSAGPKRSPLGLSADPGGFPLYKNGRVVGGVGVIADGIYGLDKDPASGSSDLDERIAQSALKGFEAPNCIRAERITAGGLALPYSNSDASLVNVSASTLGDAKVAGVGKLSAVDTYYDNTVIRAGVAFGTVASGFAPDTSAFKGSSGYILTSNATATNRYPPTSSQAPLALDKGGAGMSAAEVQELLSQAIAVANQARAQIRSPQGSAAQVTISVVDSAGNILGLVRAPDAPVFGTDVSLQKARTAAFFSSSFSASALSKQAPITYLGGMNFANGAPFTLDATYISGQSSAAKSFFGNPAVFSDGIAFSARAIGNIARPNFPDGIDANINGPFSKPLSTWSVFNDGLQLDLVYRGFTQAIVAPANTNNNCTGTDVSGNDGIATLKNGIQIFPGGFPIYRGNVFIGAIGVSGDGVDQDDMIGFLGLARAGKTLNTGIANAPAVLRADTLLPQGKRLRYAQCPQTPFNNSTEQNVCDGI